jgi:hypothetical protein
MATRSLVTRVIERFLGYRTARRFGEVEGHELRLTHNTGFFSNCSVALLEIARAGGDLDKIDVTQAFSSFKESSPTQTWNNWFAGPSRLPEKFQRTARLSRMAHRLPHHSLYRFIDFKVTRLLLDHFFSLSEEALGRGADIVRENSIDPSNTVVLCYRGTDKGTEVRASGKARYLRKVRRILDRNPNYRVWVQTDQTQARDWFLDALGSSAFSVDAIPVTEGSVVMHKVVDASFRREFGLRLLAATYLMAKCEWVVTYTGNLGYWIALYRGNTKNLIQLK